MKILYVITKANWGGAQRYVYDLATSAKEAGHEVLVAYGAPGVLVEKLETSGVRTLKVDGLARDISFKNEWRAFKETIKYCREERPDIIHVNSSKGGLTLLAARFAGIRRILFTAHGWAFNEKRPWWQKGVLRVLYALTMLLAHETICVSNAIARDVEYVPFAKRIVIRNGIDTPAFITRASARKQLLQGHSKETWLGMIAELHSSKRVSDSIDALIDIPNAILVVCGEGEERAMLEEKVVQNGLQERVFLKGFVEDAPRYLKAFDIFLVPSSTEALGYVAIEAGYAGLPVIASAVGGLPEVIRNKESGMLIPSGNSHVLSRAIRNLLEDPAIAKSYGAALKARVEKEFSKERMVQETFILYER